MVRLAVFLMLTAVASATSVISLIDWTPSETQRLELEKRLGRPLSKRNYRSVADQYGWKTKILNEPCYVVNPRSEWIFGMLDYHPIESHETINVECRMRIVDANGTQAVPGDFVNALPFSEGLAAVKIGDKWGYIGRTGEFVIPPQYDEARRFRDGRARVDLGQRAAFIDQTGKWIFERPPGQSLGELTNGRARVGTWATGFYFVDPDGQPAFPGHFRLATDFFDGIAKVLLSLDGQTRRGTYAYIDPSGAELLRYDEPIEEQRLPALQSVIRQP